MPLSLRDNKAVEASSGIKARPVNGSGLSVLIFFASFLYQDKKEHVNRSLQGFFCCDALFPSRSLGFALRASPY